VIIMRGETVTPTIEAAMVHELTVALLAQFAASPAGYSTGTPSSTLTTAAVVQADADHVTGEYLSALPPATQTTIGAAPLPTPSSAGLQASPWPLLDAVHEPFALGATLVANTRNQRGSSAVNDLLRAPPDEYVVMNPWTAFSEKRGDFEGVPEVPVGAVVIQPNVDLTGVEMLIALDHWLPWTMASDALLTWLDGTYTTYRPMANGPLCAAVAIQVPTTATPLLVEALTFWSTAMGAPVVPTVSVNRWLPLRV
jgi:hypothetical protein